MPDEPADVNMDKTLQRCVNLVLEGANIVQIDNYKQQTWIERQIQATKEKSKSMRTQETFFIQKPHDLETNKTRYNNLYSAWRSVHRYNGKCLDKNGKKKDNRRIEFGVRKNGDACVRSCNHFVPTFGCEYNENSKKCSAFYSNVLNGDGSDNYTCFVYDSQKEETTQNRNFHLAQTLGNFSINDNENICLSALYSPKTGYATWHYAFCSEPFDNIMCMFKQRKPKDICKKIDNALTDPWQNDPKSPDNTGSFVCTAEKSLQLFCKDSEQYCSIQRLPQQYVYATECADLCKVFRGKNEHKQCLYYIFNEAERVCTLMIACEQQFKISICEDTTAKNYTSGKCHQTGNDYTHPTIFNVKNDLDECKGIGRPVGKWTRGACRGSGGRGIFKGLIELGSYSNQHNCLERCNLEAHVTGCEWRKKSGYECKAHTEKVVHGSGTEDYTYCFVYKQYNDNN